MNAVENQNMEFKRNYVPEIRKEVVAFVNSDGGTILIGIEDDGIVCGLEDSDKVANQLSNALKDAIAPDIMPFVDIEKINMNGKQVVKVVISPGVNRPYYIREKGLKPSGVYVRKGSSSQPVTDEGIRQMILQNSLHSYEECRSLKQDLTFDALNKALESRNIEFGEAQKKTLKLIGEDGLYTNLALLLSDQCPITTKTAIFQGIENIVFRDRHEFSGSIIKQMDEVYHYIDLRNKTKATFAGLNRIDIRDYPEEAVREAWLNCLVHRDYSFSGSNIINIYDDRIEFVSLGGLVPGLELESIFLGISQSRNPNLASLFYRMKLIESYGTGVGKIKRGYLHKEKSPKFETAAGVFRVTLPNINEEERTIEVLSDNNHEKKQGKFSGKNFEKDSDNMQVEYPDNIAAKNSNGLLREKSVEMLKENSNELLREFSAEILKKFFEEKWDDVTEQKPEKMPKYYSEKKWGSMSENEFGENFEKKSAEKPAEDESTLVMEYAFENGSITRKETELLINSGSTKAFRILKALCANNKLKAVGNGKQVRYVPI